jgi:hypothetical protein
VASFTGIRVLSAGSFQIRASSGDMSPDTSNTLTVTNFVFSMTISAGEVQTVAFPFSVEVRVRGEDSALFTGSATITLSSRLNGVDTTLSSDTVTSGIKVFTVTETSIGIKTYVASCSGLSQITVVTVNVAKLKISSISPTVLNI